MLSYDMIQFNSLNPTIFHKTVYITFYTSYFLYTCIHTHFFFFFFFHCMKQLTIHNTEKQKNNTQYVLWVNNYGHDNCLVRNKLKRCRQQPKKKNLINDQQIPINDSPHQQILPTLLNTNQFVTLKSKQPSPKRDLHINNPQFLLNYGQGTHNYQNLK